MSLSAQVSLSVLAHESFSGSLARAIRVTPASHSATLGDGTGANKAQVTWSSSRTLSGSSETLALSGLADARDGATVSVAVTSAKVIYIKNTHASAQLTFSGGPLTSSGIRIAAGGVCVLSDASAAGMGAGSIAVAGSAGATYEIVIVGEGSIS